VTPSDFLKSIEKQPPRPIYLFVGPEAYMRRLCRRALVERTLQEADRASGVIRHDLEETTVDAVLDDARSFSLFASTRLIWVSGAEAALPKTRAGAAEAESGAGAKLAAYLRSPTPGTVVVFDVSRYEFDGDDKAKIERVQKFYSAISAVVEFRTFSMDAATRLAHDLARRAKLNIDPAELSMLAESLGADAGRIALEIEKLSLFAGTTHKVTAADIARLSPNAQGANLFALVGALGRGDRQRSLEALDALLKEGEYLPLALTFLSTQLRLGLAAQEAGLKSASQIQSYFTQQGIRIWRDRAEQIAQTVAAFPRRRLEMAIQRIYQADKALRDTRPDDRVVMEEFVLGVTAR
jgi:DNA polymerase-3 subunit delta